MCEQRYEYYGGKLALVVRNGVVTESNMPWIPVGAVLFKKRKKPKSSK